MGRTKRTQVALYLDGDKAETLRAVAEIEDMTQQDLLRQAVDTILERYEWKRERRPDGRGNIHRLVCKSK